MPTPTAHDHYKAAIALRDRIISRQVNETPVQAWAAVCRECAKANDAKRRELGDKVHGRADHSFFNNLDRVWWAAKAQVETLARKAVLQ
jgi:hypothetical protein